MAVKRILYNTLGRQRYLALISRVFLFLYRILALKKRFPQHYFIKKIIQDGHYAIDIGANLGYYTVPLSRLCGMKGKVYAIEPVPLFHQILRKNVQRYGLDNVEFLAVALGKENDKTIQMGTPGGSGSFRHGLTRVINKEDNQNNYTHTFEVIQWNPKILFRDLDRLDFIKCDVEGYEIYILPEFADLIGKFRPVFQVEISGRKNMETLFEFYKSLKYNIYYLVNNYLVLIPSGVHSESGDLYFIPEEKTNMYAHLFQPPPLT